MVKKVEKEEESDKLGQYIFNKEKRFNIPQKGLVSAETDPLNRKSKFVFDPHLDPELHWEGKPEGMS